MLTFILLSVAIVPTALTGQVGLVGQVKHPDRMFQLSELKTAKITYGAKSLTVWLMDSPSKRNEGMMFLNDKDVKVTQGMLFVFPDAQPRAFWMKNTNIPLDIAYMSAAGKVLNVEVLKPHDEVSVPSKGPTKYVLEMKKGAFKKHGIRAGTVFKIPSSIKAVL